MKIDKYIIDKAEELVFITINENNELNLKGYTVPDEGLKVPMKSEVLVKSIKEGEAEEKLNMVSMIDAILFLQGIDYDFMYNEEYDKFVAAFAKNTDFDPIGYLGYMSTQSYNKGEVSDALVYIRSLLRKSPKDVMALYQYAIICQEMALTYQKNEDIKGMNAFLTTALHALERVIDVDADFALGYYQLGFHYSNQQQYLKAKCIWEKALELGLEADLISEIQSNLDSMDFKVKYEEGYNLVFQGKPEKGLEYLLPLEENHPDWWNLLFIISLAYKSLHDLGEAKKYLEKILILRPTQVDTLVELALILAEEGNLPGAIEHLNTAAKIKKDNPEILCNLGMAHYHNGNLDDAKYYVGRAYEIDPMDEVTQACMRVIG